MASTTSKAQRIGIFIIAAVMAIGTIGSFFIMIVASKNQEIDTREQAAKQEKLSELIKKYQEENEQYEQKVKAEASELSPKYYAQVESYKSYAQPFDGSKITELGKNDIVVGSSNEVKSPDDMRAYYIGWNEKAKIFDSSLNDDKTLKAPFSPSSAIAGWQQGVVGMKIGGVRELSIPSNLAYGSEARGDDIPANSSLKFIIVAIEKSSLQAPEIPQELMEMYGSM